MGLLQKAVETYDNMSHLAGIAKEGEATLAPISFISTTAKTEITLTVDGEFIKAEQVEEKIILPVTQSSAGRTGNAKTQPHPLCDKLMYMLPENAKSYEEYLKRLKEWCDSEFSNERITAIYKYVSSGTIRHDLTRYDIPCKEDDVVCWRVIGDDEADSVWTNKQIIESYVSYYTKKVSEGTSSFCYITGQILPSAEQHLKGAVPLYGNAKLISSNDGTNYTYRGRFISADEALGISYEASQKAHNALKWIVENNRVYYGGRTFICWNPKGKPLPSLQHSLSSKFAGNEKPTPSNYGELLQKVIRGYSAEMDDDDQAIFAIFDAATSGRLSVLYYNEFSVTDYFDRLRYWDETCAWYSKAYGVSSPSLERIVLSAFGTVKTEKNAQTFDIDDKVMAQQIQRLLICRMSKALFPADIMMSAVRKCEHLQIYDKETRNRQLFNTCAIIKKYRIDHFKEDWKMALESERKDRSYQYGRLLAVLEKAERDTYNPERDKKRETNAIRMQSVFVKRPAYAAKIIIEQVKNGYYPHHEAGSRIFYERLIGEIIQQIDECDEPLNKPLSETYLLGYYLQKNELYTKHNNNTEE